MHRLSSKIFSGNVKCKNIFGIKMQLVCGSVGVVARNIYTDLTNYRVIQIIIT